jgi:MFS family permease
MWVDRDVTRVVAARFISRVGGEAAFFVGIWGKAAFELEATATGLAVVMAALGLASLIGSAIAGVLVDRFDPRRVLIGGELLFIPVALGMVFADTIPAMVVATFLLGLVGTPVYTAIASFGPFLTDDPERLGKVNGFIEGASWAAFVVGPAVGSIITITVGLDGIFVLDAVTSAVAALIVVPVTVRQVAKQERDGSHGFQTDFATHMAAVVSASTSSSVRWSGSCSGPSALWSRCSTATFSGWHRRPWAGSTRCSVSVWSPGRSSPRGCRPG